ncbi:hypothetical protein [Nocardia heshunensis]
MSLPENPVQFPRPVDGALVHQRRPGRAEGKFDISSDIYTEVDFPQYTIHLSRQAVLWIGGMQKIFDQVLQASMEMLEVLAPIFEAINIYIDAEAETIKVVSDRVPDGRVKLEGIIPDPAVMPVPDEGYVPPGGWDPPDTANGLRWWTVNSINLYRNQWAFTATNSNPNESARSVYFSTEYDGNSMHINPCDFRDSAHGWSGLRGYPEFDSGLDTCVFLPDTGNWWLFNGQYCARVSDFGTTVNWEPSLLTDTWLGFRRIADGEFGSDEQQQWANGISCVTIWGNVYVFVAGNRIAFLNSGDGDFVPWQPWNKPAALTDVWPALKSLDDLGGIHDGSGPKAICFDDSRGLRKWILVYHSTAFLNFPDSEYPGTLHYTYLACQSDLGTDDMYYGWNAMFNYLNGPWPYPSCD